MRALERSGRAKIIPVSVLVGKFTLASASNSSGNHSLAYKLVDFATKTGSRPLASGGELIMQLSVVLPFWLPPRVVVVLVFVLVA